MRDTRTVLSSMTGNPLSGYTVKLYAYSTGTSGYSGSVLYTYTDATDGTYYADISTTMKGTITVTTSAGNVLVPTNLIGKIFQGDNQSSIEPGGTT